MKVVIGVVHFIIFDFIMSVMENALIWVLEYIYFVDYCSFAWIVINNFVPHGLVKIISLKSKSCHICVRIRYNGGC